MATLFDWQRKQEAERLEAERLELRARIEQLPRQAHARIRLETRLCDLTSRAIELETA